MDTCTFARSAGAAFLVTLLSACGGGGGGGGGSGSGSTPPPPPPPPAPPVVDNTLSSTHKPVLTGRLLDSPVAGLHYSSLAGSGTTDAEGRFTYLPGEPVTFKIGDIALPPVVGRPILLVEHFAYQRTARSNIARLLQSLDSDGNPDNGITISAQAHSAAAGRTLDFAAYDQFEIDGNALLQAAGGAITTLIDGDLASAHVAMVQSTLPFTNPVVGGWMTASPAGDRSALLLLENGMYYSMESNCNGVPGYEFGTYAYADGNISFTATVDADGASCGMNTGTQTASVSTQRLGMTLNGVSWGPVSRDQGQGVFYASGTLGNPTDHGFKLILLGASSFAAIDTACGGGAAVEFGDYSWVKLFDLDDVVGVHTNASVTATSKNTCSPSSVLSSMMIRTQQTLFNIAENATSPAVLMEIVPSQLGDSLVGGWVAEPNSGITFTSDGRYLFNTAVPACAGGMRSTGEKGTFSWDTVTSAASVRIDIETDGACGYAAAAKDGSSAISKLEVTGNVLTVTNGSRQDVLVRNIIDDGWSGIWTRKESDDAERLTFSATYQGPLANTGTVPGESVSISSLDSDCVTADSFVIEDMPVVVNANGILNSFVVDPMSMSPFTDQPDCGLTDTAGPTSVLNGDILVIEGWGMFVREQ